jgi:hypothetical protein
VVIIEGKVERSGGVVKEGEVEKYSYDTVTLEWSS